MKNAYDVLEACISDSLVLRRPICLHVGDWFNLYSNGIEDLGGRVKCEIVTLPLQWRAYEGRDRHNVLWTVVLSTNFHKSISGVHQQIYSMRSICSDPSMKA